jgi:signal transduction histidine kinase
MHSLSKPPDGKPEADAELVSEAALIAALDEERRRIAEHLHDTVCQTLSAVQFMAHLAARKISGESPEGAQGFRELAQHLDRASGELQELVADLRADGDDETATLDEELRGLAQDLSRWVPCVVEVPPSAWAKDVGAFVRVVRHGVAWLRESGKVERLRLVWLDEEAALELIATVGTSRRKVCAGRERRLELLRCRARLIGVELKAQDGERELRICFRVRSE